MQEHKEELEEWAGESLDEIKRQNLIKDGQLKDLEISKRKREMIDPAELRDFLKAFGLALSSTLTAKEKNLESKCPGFEMVIRKEFVDIFDLVQKEIAQWK